MSGLIILGGSGFLAGTLNYREKHACKTRPVGSFHAFFNFMKYLSFPLSFGCLFLVFTLSGCAKFDGAYQGVVKNQSYDVTADLFLSLRETNGVVSGSMTIGAPLHGGGAVSGWKRAADVEFTTSDGAGGRISWIGKISGKRIEGHYVVEPSGVTVLLAGGEKQQGIWAVSQ